MGVATMPKLITFTPDLRMPRDNAAANSGPDKRPSKPIQMSVCKRALASLPSACPIDSTIAGVKVLPTIPRIS